MANRILVIDDDEPSRRLVQVTFDVEGFTVLMAHDAATGLAKAASEAPDVILLDVGLPDMSGLDVLEQLKATESSVPVVMLTASRDVKTAVRATQLGAFDYLTKPIDHDDLLGVVRRAVDTRALHREVEDLRKRVARGEGDQLTREMGPGAAVKHVVEQVGVVASSNFSVLILGETGTGKELVARAVHRQSDRRAHPFIALDCGAIPEALLESELFGHEKGAFTGADRRRPGQFQLAEGGTCFLDEIGNLPGSLQSKLLRVLESRQMLSVGSDRAKDVDIRFVAATNEDLQTGVGPGHFRSDLYFRLAQYTITLPPLRQRPDDIPYLSQRFLEEASVELRRPVQQLLPAAIEMLQGHQWPGNVRELRNVVRQAVLRSTLLVIRAADIRVVLNGIRAATPAEPQRSANQSLKQLSSDASRAAERQAICDTLRATTGNISQAAKVLGVDYKTLHVKLKRLQVRARDYGP